MVHITWLSLNYKNIWPTMFGKQFEELISSFKYLQVTLTKISLFGAKTYFISLFFISYRG